MGYIKAKLKNSSKIHVVDRSFPSAQICPVLQKMKKDGRIKVVRHREIPEGGTLKGCAVRTFPISMTGKMMRKFAIEEWGEKLPK